MSFLLRALRAPILILLMAFCAVAPAAAKELSPDERAAFEAVDPRLPPEETPEIIQEAIQELQRKHEEAARLARIKVIEDKSGPLFTSDAGMVIGNPQGDVTLIEFIRLQLRLLQEGSPDIRRSSNPTRMLRLILRDFPILSKKSQEAAVVAMALKKQLSPEKFWAFHAQLMGLRGRIGEPQALDVAREVGADMERLANDMKSDTVRRGLAETMDLAEKLDISGTPSYILGEEVVARNSRL